MSKSQHKLSKEQDQEIAKLHLGGMKIGEIANYFGVHPDVIRVSLKYEGVTPNLYRVHIKEDAFSNLFDEHSCYWLGFIYADGCVSNKKYPTFSVKLKQGDKEHLDKLRKFLEIETPIHACITKSKGIEYEQVYIHSSNGNFSARLRELGIEVGRPNPSHALKEIPHPMYNHFFRGMFDGDGCAHKYPRFTFLSQETMLEALRKDLIQKGLVSDVRKVYQTGKIHRIDYNGLQQCLNIKKYLYESATVFMERKLNVVNSWSKQTATLYKKIHET